MIQRKGKKTLYTILVVLAAIVLIVGVAAFVKSMNNTPATDTSTTTSEETPEVSEEANSIEESTPEVPEDTTDEAEIDPTLVSTVAIDPMTIEVSYMKGIEGFEFQVARNLNGTNYVQFSSPNLVGTKCTNDAGVFASIIEEPTVDETATLTKTTTVDGTVYGLSLTDESCTNDEVLLKQYQEAFSQPFSLLKKI